MAERRSFSDTAVATKLTNAISSSDTTITIDASTGWPAGGASGPAVATIGRGTATEERIKYGSRTGNTLSSVTRGLGGTTASAHAAGTPVEHTWSANDADLVNRHAANTTDDDHTQYMKTDGTRHDLSARHTFGAALGTPGSPTTIVPDAAASAGAGAAPAKEDHTHGITAAAPGSIEPDDVAAEGVATSFARSDHKHAITAAAPGTISPDDTASEGAATSFARSDHRHAITAAAPVTIGSSNTEGVATSFARSDHQHAMPSTAAAGEVAASEATNSSSYVDLTTVGPSYTMTPPASGKVLVFLYARLNNDTAGNGAVMGFAMSGGNVSSASDDKAIEAGGPEQFRKSGVFLLTGLTATSTTFTCKYKRRTGGIAGFEDRKIFVMPVVA